MSRLTVLRRISAAIIAALCGAVPLLTTSGCTPYKELKELGIVEGAGFDIGTGGGFTITFQIFNTEGGGGGNAGGTQKSGGGNTVETVQGNGMSIYDAIRNATLQLGKTLYFANATTYVFSETLCRTNFDGVVDFLERSPDVRPNVHVLVAKSSAYEIMTAKRDGAVIPMDRVEELLQNYSSTSKIHNVTIRDLYNSESSGYTDLSLPAIKAGVDGTGSDRLSIDGTAVFHRNKLVGYLNNTQSRGILWLLGEVTGGILVLGPPGGGRVSMEITGSSAKTQAVNKNGKAVISVKVSFQTNITEMETPGNRAVTQDFVEELKNLQNAEVRREIGSALQQTQLRYGADVYGFGMDIYHAQPALWRQMSGSWESAFRSLPIEVSVESDVQYSGLLVNKITNGSSYTGQTAQSQVASVAQAESAASQAAASSEQKSSGGSSGSSGASGSS